MTHDYSNWRVVTAKEPGSGELVLIGCRLKEE